MKFRLEPNSDSERSYLVVYFGANSSRPQNYRVRPKAEAKDLCLSMTCDAILCYSPLVIPPLRTAADGVHVSDLQSLSALMIA